MQNLIITLQQTRQIEITFELVEISTLTLDKEDRLFFIFL